MDPASFGASSVPPFPAPAAPGPASEPQQQPPRSTPEPITLGAPIGVEGLAAPAAAPFSAPSAGGDNIGAAAPVEIPPAAPAAEPAAPTPAATPAPAAAPAEPVPPVPAAEPVTPVPIVPAAAGASTPANPVFGPKPTLLPASATLQINLPGGDPNVTAAAMTVLDDKSRVIADKIALARAELAAIDAALARGYAKVNGTKVALAANANATAAALKSAEYAKLRDLRKRLEATFG